MCNKSFLQNKTRVLFSSVWIFLLFIKVKGDTWKDVTACYGSDDDCSQYEMECTGGTTIVIGKLMYGTKTGLQDCQYGISNCNEADKVAACCTYNTSDTFTPFSANNLSAIFENCEGKYACAGWAPRLKTTPFSSYVWMQYACVNETNATDMCKNNTIVGNDLFIRFNMTSSNLLDDVSRSKDCSCRISTPNCNVAMTTTFVDLDFHLPQLEISPLESSSIACSASSLELATQNKTYNCQNTQLYTKGHTFERMSEITMQSPDEIVSLKNVNSGGLVNGPSYIVLYFKTLPQQPLLINCFEPGIQTSITNHCQKTSTEQTSTETPSLLTTPSTQQNSTDISTLFSAASSPSSYNPSYEVSSGVPSESTSTISSSTPTSSSTTELPTVQLPSVKPFTQSSQLTTSAFDSKTSDQTEIRTTSVFSSESVSNTFHQTLPFTEQSSTYFPSTERPNRPLSDSRPQSHQSTITPSLRPDSISTLLSTSTAIFSSTKQSNPPITTEVASNVTDDTLTVPATSGVTNLSKPTSTSTTSTSTLSTSNATASVTEVSNSNTNSSESRHGNNSLNGMTTVSVDQNVNTNIEKSTNVGDSATQSTLATTRKPIDDNKNNNGLIIGVTVAVVIVVLIIVAVVMVCLCIRVKRKEKVRRNYVRNTNIFYSFPEDYSEAGNTVSDSSPKVGRREPSFSSIPRSPLYESVGNPSPSSTLRKATSPLYFDDYKIKSSDADDADVYEKESYPFSRMPNDNSYVGETSNETIDFVNGVENDDSLKVDSNSNVENGGKSVSFDPSVYYAKVRKEGKTKF